MRKRRVLVDDPAKADLIEIADWIARRGAPISGKAFVGRIRAYIKTLDTASERGQRLDDVAAGLRLVSFEGVSIAVHVDDHTVTVLRVLYGGRDVRTALEPLTR